MAFILKRGTNVSHWLSQSEARGDARRKRLTRDDVQRLAAMGFDHLRLPVDEEQMWNVQNQQEPEAWDILNQGLDWCHEAGLRAVVDLHILRSHQFTYRDANCLFNDPAAGERFGQCWLELSSALKSRSVDWVGYELLNEAVADDPEDWNRVLLIPYKVIRDREPNRLIAIGSNRWCQAKTFPELKVPANDPNLLLVFHYYNPMLITHHKAHWWPGGGKYAGPLQYPGKPVPDEALEGLEPTLRKCVEEENYPFDTNTIEDQIKPALVRAKELGLGLWCNEFGVISTVPDDIRRAWYHDFLSVLNKHNIAWTNWDMRGGFGVFDSQNQTTVVAEALLR